MEKEYITSLKEVGSIAKQAVAYARSIVKKDMPLLEIAEKIEAKIIFLGAKPAFPVNLSIDNVAAHYTPAYNDTSLTHGLLKVDIGVHKEGIVADTAFSIDLENNKENKALIEAAQAALDAATKVINLGVKISAIGAAIEKAIEEKGFQPVHNLSGHSIEPYNLHAGITIPNFDNKTSQVIEPGLYAIEPFATTLTGSGAVRDGKPSNIYHIQKEKSVRDAFAREVLKWIIDEYSTLPFCSRWVHKKFGTRGLLALRQIEAAGILHHYPQLIESGNGIVAQAEHTVIITAKEKIITTQ